MAAGTFNMTGDLKLEAGSKWDFTIPFTNELGAAIDLTDYDPSADVAHIGARITMRQDVDDLNAVPAVLELGKAASDGAEGLWIVQPPTLGQIRMVIEADTSAALSFAGGEALEENREGVLQIEVATDSENDAYRIGQGDYEITPESTR